MARNEIIKINQHAVRCGDIMDGIDELMGDNIADLVYTDPPWGQGLLKYWQTKNKKDTGSNTRLINHDLFLKKLFSILFKYSRNNVFVEYGKQWRDQIVHMGVATGFKHGGLAITYYRSGSVIRPSDIHLFTKNNSSVSGEMKKNALELKGYPLVESCFKEYGLEKGIALDPMCGMGYSAKAAISMDMKFYGNELNSKRLEKTKTIFV